LIPNIPLFLMYTSGTTGGKPRAASPQPAATHLPPSSLYGRGHFASITRTNSSGKNSYWWAWPTNRLDHRPFPTSVYGPARSAPPSFSMTACRVPLRWRFPWRYRLTPRRQLSTLSPTAILVVKAVHRLNKKNSYHFKHMTTVGEPIEPEVWALVSTSRSSKARPVIGRTWLANRTVASLHHQPGSDEMNLGSAAPRAGISPLFGTKPSRSFGPRPSHAVR